MVENGIVWTGYLTFWLEVCFNCQDFNYDQGLDQLGGVEEG